jgi:hypothetical protein
LRNIQYYLPNHIYSDFDKKILYVNAPYFSKHSKYLTHLIKSIDWDRHNEYYNTNKLEFIAGILNGDMNKTCQELFCTRTCSEELSCDDCINILYSKVDYLPNELLQHFFNIISESPEEVILCHIHFFITLIRCHSGNDLVRVLLYNLLMKIDNETGEYDKLAYSTYWHLNSIRDECSPNELKNISNFIKMMDPTQLKKLDQEYLFFNGLIANLDNPKRYLFNNFDLYKPISLPYNPRVKIIGYNADTIITKQSYTHPTIITFMTECNDQEETDEPGIEKILFKKESIINDGIVLNLITLCNIVLKDNLNQEFDHIIYPTIPITNKSGMIKIIDKAETLHEITNKKKTILQYIISHNEDKAIGEVMNRYMFSLVSYTLHNYFLGLGDRHLQNIMITHNGAIFHIDFGFILGNDAYPLIGTEIKLNSTMIDVIGGTDSDRYEQYLKYCSVGMVILRKYFNIFFILLSQNRKFKEKQVEKFILNRFQPRQIDSVVVSELLSIIKNSTNAFPDLVREFLHYHTQEKTVQHGLGKIVSTAIDTVKNMTGSGETQD